MPLTSRPARIDGLDVARALAIFGMFAAHIGNDSAEDGWPWLSVAHGRPSALFAVLAGISITLMLTRRAGVTGDLAPASAVAHTRVRVAVRALILIPMGYVLSWLETPVVVILANLGVMFLLSLVAFRWRARWLWVGAAACVALGQFAVRSITPAVQEWGVYGTPPLEKLWSEHYPAITWMGYLLAGMAIGRLALTLRRTQALLGAAGLVGLALVAGVEALAGGADATSQSAWLATVAHTYSPLEMAGNLASASLVIGLCLWLGQVARPVMWPLMAAGSMALTLYVAHIILIAVVGDEIVWESTNVAYLAVCLSAIAFASLWRWLVDQGPLEKVLSVASMAAADAVVGEDSRPSVSRGAGS
ncbi:heparan-alpha-glucosaminide N-acetyltransferase domain-containing protein [Demequina aurantiaca]|uniref:heparan-alpha-glucosaminide N-acetyltransferase domain-containing protein n=1 Tax=Demequina aurantiaca TaxID=676200 RepID=UPI003D329B40